MIYMWKDEQFGLTFLAVLNRLGGPHGQPMVLDEDEGKVEEAYGCAFGDFRTMRQVCVGSKLVFLFI